MQKKTRSILEELDTIYNDRYAGKSERRYVVESRANNVIASAVRLMEQIEELYDAESAENLQRKLLNAIRLRDPDKFARSVRRADESK
jgi:FPC/CPF motif-containing protein YcgG